MRLLAPTIASENVYCDFGAIEVETGDSKGELGRSMSWTGRSFILTVPAQISPTHLSWW